MAQIAGEKQSSVPLPSPVQKRKADGDLQRTTDKLAKKNPPVASSATTMMQTKKPANPLLAVVNPRPSTVRVNVSTSSNGTGAATASAAEPAKPPKKGSYAEILARAKAAQATLGKVGKIQHKAIEKGLSKRERQELKEKGSQSHRVSKRPSQSSIRTHARDARNGERAKSGKVSSRVKGPAVPEKKIKKAAIATTGYTGTARPNPAAINSSKSSTPSRAADKSGYGRSSSGRRDTYASEDEDEEDEVDEEDYYSDASSDMEAAMFEVDEEEERAARIARKEDEEALRQEARHQREKEEKRRRLAELAKAKR